MRRRGEQIIKYMISPSIYILRLPQLSEDASKLTLKSVLFNNSDAEILHTFVDNWYRYTSLIPRSHASAVFNVYHTLCICEVAGFWQEFE